MSRGAEGPTETMGFGFLAGVVVTILVGIVACQHNDSPKAKADHRCEVAWVDANDGDPETHPAPIIDQAWCKDHNTTMTVPEEATP